MDSDLSEIEVDEEVFTESPGPLEDDLDAQEPEEDDDYQYTPNYEDDEERVQVKRSGRSRRQPTRLAEEEDHAYQPKMTSKRATVTDDDDLPTPSKRRKAATIDLQSYEEEEEEEDEDQGQQHRINSRNKMIMELMDGNSPRKRDRLTEEELQLRRAENARKRKNMSEKKLEEEKQDTINKLLRRRAGKSRSNVSLDKGNPEDEGTYVKPRRAYHSEGLVRVIRTKDDDLYCTY